MDNKRFIPTELGEIVLELIREFFPDILDAEFTAKMEQEFDSVEEGSIEWIKVIDEFYKEFAVHLAKAEVEMEKIEIKDEPAGEDCVECGHGMVFKMGRYGKFMACSNFPDCRNTKPIVKEIGVKCPKCKEGNIIERKSKKRRIFYGCDTYLDVTSYHGINHCRGVVQNVKVHLLRKTQKRRGSSVWIVISKKCPKHRKDREIVYFPCELSKNPKYKLTRHLPGFFMFRKV